MKAKINRKIGYKMFEFYTDKFKDFTVSDDKTVNEAIKTALICETVILTCKISD